MSSDSPQEEEGLGKPAKGVERRDSKPQRDHHVIPRYYLSGFEIPNDHPFIWVYQKGIGYNPPKAIRNPSKLSTKKNAGIIRDFYAHYSVGREPDYDSVEKSLKAHEDAALHVLKKIREFGLINEEEKQIFATYIVHIIRRSQFARNFTSQVITPLIEEFHANGVIRATVACYWDALNEVRLRKGRPPLGALNVQTLESLAEMTTETLKSDPNSSREAHLYMQNAPIGELRKRLIETSWVFFRVSGEDRFITSDNPIYSPGMKSEADGLAFPISSELCLMAFRGIDGPTRFQEVDSEAVRSMNQITAGRCISHFFSSENRSSLIAESQVAPSP